MTLFARYQLRHVMQSLKKEDIDPTAKEDLAKKRQDLVKKVKKLENETTGIISESFVYDLVGEIESREEIFDENEVEESWGRR